MIELTLTVCLLAAPSDCRQERVPFEGSIFVCALQGQQAAQEWLASHPKWRLQRWRCGPPEVRA